MHTEITALQASRRSLGRLLAAAEQLQLQVKPKRMEEGAQFLPLSFHFCFSALRLCEHLLLALPGLALRAASN